MIIKLKGADFSANNIGTLSTYSIRFVGSGVTNSNTSVDRKSNTGYTTTITLGTGYELNGSITVTMGGTDITSSAVSGLTITIPTKVTGNVVITVPTKNTAGGEEPVNPTPGTNNYIDITVQGTEKGSIKNSVVTIPEASSLYLITKVQLPSNAISVEYQAFKTGGSYGSAFVNDAGTVVKFLPRTDITTGDRVTETIPSGATWFYHMYDNPDEDTQTAPAFTYIRVYTSGESGGSGGAEGLPVRITEQTQNNHGLLDTTTGTWTVQTYPVEQGGQTVTVCSIPAGATTVNYQMFKTGKTYGSGFFNGSTFISGYANNNEAAGTRKTLSIPAGATEFWHMYPNRTYANGDGNCPEFDYIEFA
jgi:hypothetical protein